MLARLSAFVIWALVAAASVFWGLRLLVRPSPPPASAVTLGDGGAVSADLSRLLGAEEIPQAIAVAPASTRFKLLGVMAGRPDQPGAGVALISIDGKPPRTYAVGARVEDQLVVQSLGLRNATLGPAQGTPAFVLEIPPLPAPATGTLGQVPGADMQSPSPAAPVAPPVAMPPPSDMPAQAVDPSLQPSVPLPGEMSSGGPGAPSMAPLEQPAGLGPSRGRDGAAGPGR